MNITPKGGLHHERDVRWAQNEFFGLKKAIKLLKITKFHPLFFLYHIQCVKDPGDVKNSRKSQNWA